MSAVVHFLLLLTPLITLIVIFAASLAVFIALTRRWTSGRKWIALEEWARARKFRLSGAERLVVPPPLASLPELKAQPRWMLSDATTVLVQLESSAAPEQRWNILIRSRESDWPASGLRPAHQSTSILDWFSLSSFPSAIAPE